MRLAQAPARMEDIEKYFIYQAMRSEAAAMLGLSEKGKHAMSKLHRGPESHFITGMANNDTEANRISCPRMDAEPALSTTRKHSHVV